jgi:hypothetical protein
LLLLLLLVVDRLSLPWRLGDGLRLISSLTGRRLGLRLREREEDADRDRLCRLPRRRGERDRLNESVYRRLLGIGERLLSSDPEALPGDDVFRLRAGLRDLEFLSDPLDLERFRESR